MCTRWFQSIEEDIPVPFESGLGLLGLSTPIAKDGERRAGG